MAFTMNKDRINLRGSADTPGPFSADHTSKITMANKMADGVPDGPGSQGEAMGPILKPGDETYEERQARTGNEAVRNADGSIDNSSTTRSVSINQGQGGKSKGTATTRTVRRVKGEMESDANRRGVGRIGEETTTRDRNGKIMSTRTKLAGTSGFNRDGTIKEASVNSIKTRGTTTSSMPTADVLKKKKKKGPTMMYSGNKH